MHQAAFRAIEMWAKIQHPSIATVKEAFTTRAFNDNCKSLVRSFTKALNAAAQSLVVAYTYHPNARTLFDVHLKPKQPAFLQGRPQVQQSTIPERTLWTYIVQIAGAVKKAHDVGCPVRMIDATKVLLTGKNRWVAAPSRYMACSLIWGSECQLSVRISSCGILDVIMHDTHQDVHSLLQEDLAMFGRLLFALCCNNLAAVNNLTKSLETMGRLYSLDLKNVALWLISKPGPHKV